MDFLIKQAKPMGNSASVYVPKEWENKKVVLRLLSPKEMALSALGPWMANVIGVYLYGSYARGEESERSDIDVLVVANQKIGVDCEKPLNLLVLTQDKVESILSNDPVQLAPIIAESRALVNESYLGKLRSVEINPRKYLGFVRGTKNRLSEYLPMIKGKRQLDAVVYSMVLRLRAVHLVNLMLSGGKYTHSSFSNYLTNLGLGESRRNLLEIHRRVRDNLPLPERVVTLDDILRLHDALLRENQKLEDRIIKWRKEAKG